MLTNYEPSVIALPSGDFQAVVLIYRMHPDGEGADVEREYVDGPVEDHEHALHMAVRHANRLQGNESERIEAFS